MSREKIIYTQEDLQTIGAALCDWFEDFGRDLPWRGTRNPYFIWVSEVMLQQTRVETVKAYYENFLNRFPTVQHLAQAQEEEVLKAWEGLGYYRRARYLHKGAQWVVRERGGEFPTTPDELLKIPGIGDYCAGSIASLAFGREVPCVDGNVMRVLSRICRYEEQVDKSAGKKEITRIAGAMIPSGRVWSHNQALMELGALVCLPKTCREDLCPVREYCLAKKAGIELTLPVKSARKEQTVLHRRIFLIVDGERILVRQRQKGEGLLEGLWEFPGQDENQGFSGACKVIPLQDAETVPARHVFTHRIWEMQGIECSWPRDTEIPPDCRWADRKLLSELPFPGAMRAYVSWAKKRLRRSK